MEPKRSQVAEVLDVKIPPQEISGQQSFEASGLQAVEMSGLQPASEMPTNSKHPMSELPS